MFGQRALAARLRPINNEHRVLHKNLIYSTKPVPAAAAADVIVCWQLYDKIVVDNVIIVTATRAPAQ